MTVRLVEPSDAETWRQMRQTLWPGYGDHAAAIASYFALPPSGADPAGPVVFIALNGDQPCGFLELGLRDFAEGCCSSPVPYIEGWWVEPSQRHRGAGRALMQAAADWAQHHGYHELASSCAQDNTPSAAAHQSCGFEPVQHVICFRKCLKP